MIFLVLVLALALVLALVLVLVRLLFCKTELSVLFTETASTPSLNKASSTTLKKERKKKRNVGWG